MDWCRVGILPLLRVNLFLLVAEIVEDWKLVEDSMERTLE
jgi:hypothetical protein